MDKLLSCLKSIPEYELLLKSVSKGQAAAVTGIGQINRSHLIAALQKDTNGPMVVLCQDDNAGVSSPVLPIAAGAAGILGIAGVVAAIFNKKKK